MTTDFAAIKPQLGKGIYSIPDAAAILNMPKGKVRRWIKKYWELEFLQDVEDGYTWGESREKAFHFLTLIEIIAVDSFRQIGVSFPKIKLAHAKLSEMLETKYPFAHAELMTDGKRIFYELLDTSLLEVDEKQQLSFNKLVAPYCKKIDFQDKTHLG
ncbi:MAG: helix-turn-helix domain-containing protein [Melioribacteraceae bacterium]|nr:helix-turn-helix domain-containing protein [Melioribacteraceae bacterium]